MEPIDPRTKLALGLMAIIAILITHKPLTLGVECFLLFVALYAFGLSRPWITSLRLVMPMVCLVFLISLFSFDLQTAFILSLRLFNLLTLSFVFFRSISPEEVGDAVRKMGIPYEFSFILTTSMRYVPLIGRRLRLIMDAQRSRGIDLRPRIKNLKNFTSFLMPLLVQSFLLSEELAMAMESRGFTLKGRSYQRDYHIAFWEYGLMILLLIFLVFFGWWERG